VPESWQAAKNLILAGLRVPESWRTAKNQPLTGSIAALRDCCSPFKFTGRQSCLHMPIKTKAEALKIIHDCAVLYKNNLAGKNLLFITILDNEAIEFETAFMPRNYMHLTGVSSQFKGDLFYRAALNNRLSINDITLSPDGKTEQKLDVLPQLMNIHLSARMIGDYNNTRPLLIADKFAGTVTMAMGFIQINDVYIPRTALKVDMREITTQAARRRIAVIFVKQRTETLYTHLSYIAKGMTIDDDILTPILHKRVDIQNLTALFPIPHT
jgi:hypothetical protein